MENVSTRCKLSKLNYCNIHTHLGMFLFWGRGCTQSNIQSMLINGLKPAKINLLINKLRGPRSSCLYQVFGLLNPIYFGAQA